MSILFGILTLLHVLVCLILILVVLLQTGKGADIAGVFGGGGTQTAFGPRGVENTLSRLTKYAAVIFMVTSITLSLIKSKEVGGKFGDVPTEAERAAESGAEAESAADDAATTVPSDDAAVPPEAEDGADTATEPAPEDAAADAPSANDGGSGGDSDGGEAPASEPAPAPSP